MGYKFFAFKCPVLNPGMVRAVLGVNLSREECPESVKAGCGNLDSWHMRN
jgi:hypothetical protein